MKLNFLFFSCKYYSCRRIRKRVVSNILTCQAACLFCIVVSIYIHHNDVSKLIYRPCKRRPFCTLETFITIFSVIFPYTKVCAIDLLIIVENDIRQKWEKRVLYTETSCHSQTWFSRVIPVHPDHDHCLHISSILKTASSKVFWLFEI